jgi:hypothetical protein
MKNKIIIFFIGIVLILLFLSYSAILEKARRFLAPEEMEEAEVVILEGSGSIGKDVLIIGLCLLPNVNATRLMVVHQKTHKEATFSLSPKDTVLLSQELEHLGLKNDQIQILEVPSDHPITLTGAEIVLSGLSKEGVKRAILLCEGFHTRRSYWVYREIGMPLGIKIFPYPYFIRYEKQTWWQKKQGIHFFISEALKFFYYILKGYIPMKSLLYP